MRLWLGVSVRAVGVWTGDLVPGLLGVRIEVGCIEGVVRGGLLYQAVLHGGSFSAELRVWSRNAVGAVGKCRKTLLVHG